MRNKLVVLTMLSLMVTSEVAISKPFGASSSTSSSRSSAASTSPRSSTGGGFGANKSIGIRRPDSVKQMGAPKPVYTPSPSPQYTPNRNNNYYNTPTRPSVAKQGHSTGALVGAAAAGALAGHLLTPSSPTVVQQPAMQQAPMPTQQQYIPPVVDQPQYQQPMQQQQVAPIYYPQAQPIQQDNSSSSGWWLIFLLLALGGLAYYFFLRKPKFTATSTVTNPVETKSSNVVNTTKYSEVENATTELDFLKVDFFHAFQTNNKPSKVAFYKENVHPSIVDDIVEMVLSEDETKTTTVKNLVAKPAIVWQSDETRTLIGSVAYTADIVELTADRTETITPISMVWNFSRENGKWLLAGIETN